MSPFFRKSEARRAEEAQADAEITRLKAVPPRELAVTLFPALGPDGPAEGHYAREQQICEYLLRDFPGARGIKPLQIIVRVRTALERLEEEGLAESISYQRGARWRLTEYGTATLADGTIVEKLAVGGAGAGSA